MRDAFVSLAQFLGDGAGQLGAPMTILLRLMLLDELTGVGKAIYLRELTSEIGVHGLLRKGECIVLIVALHLFQPLLPGAPALDAWLAVGFSFFELLSVAENAARIGVPLPPQLVGIMRAFESVQPLAKITKSTTETKTDDPAVPDVLTKTVAIETVVKEPKP